MKRSKREENAIIIHFSFYFILTSVLIIFTFFSIYPKIKQIEADKSTSKQIIEKINRIEKFWLSFKEFNSFSNTWNNSRIIKEIIKSMTPEFYKANLVNDTDENYTLFLDKKNKELNSEENIELIYNKNKNINKILPWYSDESINFWELTLTDYKFVNYVESLIESFNLTTNSPIGINKLVLLKDFVVSDKWDWKLGSNIFYIPLNLSLNGNKWSLIKFLYFIENVWNIKIEDGDIIINDNYRFLGKNWIKKVLIWDKFSSDYNIFKNQMIDIDKISISEYIDNSYISRGNTEFKKYIIKDQWLEDYDIKVNLKFYVKWLPTYKIEEYITWILAKHKKVMWLISKELKNEELKWINRIKLTNKKDILNWLTKEISSIRKALWKKWDLESLYKKVIKIDSIVDPIFISIKK